MSTITCKWIMKMKFYISKSVKYFGVIFDRTLRFDEYIRLLVKKAYLVLRVLYRNSRILYCKILVIAILNYNLILYYICLDVVTKNPIQII